MIAAIIVLYAPELTRLRGNIQLLQTLQWPVIVIDNSPESHRELLSKGIVYHHLASNKGIAAAQNLGLQAAKELGAKTAMLLDQDSLLSEQFLIQSAQRFATAQGLFPNLAALGPSIVSEFSMQTERARLQRSQAIAAGLFAM